MVSVFSMRPEKDGPPCYYLNGREIWDDGDVVSARGELYWEGKPSHACLSVARRTKQLCAQKLYRQVLLKLDPVCSSRRQLTRCMREMFDGVDLMDTNVEAEVEEFLTRCRLGLSTPFDEGSDSEEEEEGGASPVERPAPVSSLLNSPVLNALDPIFDVVACDEYEKWIRPLRHSTKRQRGMMTVARHVAYFYERLTMVGLENWSSLFESGTPAGEDLMGMNVAVNKFGFLEQVVDVVDEPLMEADEEAVGPMEKEEEAGTAVSQLLLRRGQGMLGGRCCCGGF